MTQREIFRKFDEIVAFAEVEKFLDTPVKYYSSGMYVRLAFAVAAHLEPEILIVDEVLAVGDIEFQKKCLGRMDEISRRQGRTVLFVTHNMAAVRAFCAHGLLLEKGRLEFSGGIDDCIQRYSHVKDSLTLSEWTRPPGQELRPISFKKITSRLLGSQPNLVFQIVCSFDGRTPHRSSFVAFDIADAFGTVFMQALPSIEPFIEVGTSEKKYCFDIELPALVPGRYLVTAWVGPHNTDTYDLCRECLAFDVLDSPTIGRAFPHTSDHGVLVPKCTVTPMSE